MNSSNLDSSVITSNKKKFEQSIFKLSNGIVISLVFLFLFALGWYFEQKLSSIEQQSLTITIESTLDESPEDESQTTFDLIDNEVTNRIARLLAIELLDTSLSLVTINDLPVTNELDNIERTSVLVLALKLMIEKKHYPEAMTVLNKLSLAERLNMGLQFSKAFAESKMKLPQAVNSYRQLLKEQPGHQAAIVNLSLLYLGQELPAKAELLLRQHIETMSGAKKAKAYAALGRSLEKQFKYKAAQVFFLKSIELRPSHSATWRKLANARAAEFNNHPAIIDSFEKAIALDVKNIELKMQYSFYLIKKMEYRLAIEQLKQARRFARDRFSIRIWLAFCYNQVKKPINANKQLSIANEYTESTNDKTKIIAFKNYLAGEFRKSIDQFKILLKKNRDNDFEYLMIASAYSGLRKRKSAKVYLDKIGLRSNLYFAAQMLLAENFARSKQYTISLKVYQKMIDSIDNGWQIYYKISQTAVKAGEVKLAISAIDQALLLNHDKKLQLHKAKVLWRLDQKLAAIDALESLLESKPNYLRAIYRLADYNLQIGDQNSAFEHFKRLLAVHPDYADVQYRLAVLHFEQGDFTDARRLLNDYLAKSSDSIQARMLYARVFCETGQLADCKEQLQLLLKLDSDYQPAIEYAKAKGVD